MASRTLFAAGLLLLTAGCVSRGVLYSRTTEPATEDFAQTPIGTKHAEVCGQRLREPISGYGVSAEWDSDYLRAAARQAGISSIYYADLETITVAFGIYRHRTLIIYGD
jgi:hypothetical protein